MLVGTESNVEEILLRDALRSRGLRCTTQRLAMMALLGDRREHLTAPEIFERLRVAGDGMDLATVYRTLSMLSAVGVIDALALPERATRYGSSSPAHHHALCGQCGRITDIDRDVLGPALERLAELGVVRADGARLVVRGLCRGCQDGARAGFGPLA